MRTLILAVAVAATIGSGTGRVISPAPGRTLSPPAESTTVVLDSVSAYFPAAGCISSGAFGTFGAPGAAWRLSTKAGPTAQVCKIQTGYASPAGLHVEPLSNIRNRGSDTLDSVTFWPAAGTITRAADQYIAPDGTLTGDKLTSSTASAFVYGQALFIPTTAGPVAFWGYTRADTGTITSAVAAECAGGGSVTACTCSSVGGSCTPAISGVRCIISTTATTAWTYLSGSASCSVATASWYVEPVPNQGGTGSAGFWRMGIREGGFPVVPSITTTASVTNQPDTVTFVNPLTTAQHCVKVTATAPWGRSWTALNSTLWTQGVTDAVDSAKLIATTGGTLDYTVFDNLGGVKTLSATHGFAAGSEHFIQACNDNGTLSLFDGTTNLGGSVTGVGTGTITTQPMAFFLGSGSAQGSESGFAFKSFCAVPGLGTGACPAAAYSAIAGAKRYVWQGMPKEYRTHSRGLTAWPFTWPPDPTPRSSYRRRTALLNSTTWSNDATTINVPADYDTLNNGQQYRDGSVWYDRQAMKFFSTIASIGPQTNTPAWSGDRWSVFSSLDGLTWDFVTYVIPTGATTSWRVWTPEFFADDDGTAYVLVSYSEASGRGFKIKLYRADDPGAFTSWTDLGDISGTALRTGTNGEIDYHDVFLIKRAGTYHLFSRCAATAGTCVGGEIDHTTSASIQTGYNTRNVVQYAGPVNLIGEGVEVAEMDDGTFKLFYDDYNGGCAGQICSIDMATLASVGGARTSVIGDADAPNRNTVVILGF